MTASVIFLRQSVDTKRQILHNFFLRGISRVYSVWQAGGSQDIRSSFYSVVGSGITT